MIIMDTFKLNTKKFYKDIEFAIKNNYVIKIFYTKEINYDLDNKIIWKYPPYLVKNCIIEKIINEIDNYFKNSNDYLIVMYFEGDDIIHKIPLNLPIEKIE